MEQRTFGRTGFDVSVLGFGGAPVGFLETKQEQVARIVNLLLDRGVNVIDTAAMYHGSEEAIGKAIADRREEYVLISKCGHDYPDLEGEPWSSKVVEQTVDRSLRRLRTDTLDVMLLHSCDLATLRQGEALEALVRARDEGKVRFVGYSGDNEAAAYAAGLADVAVIETSVNICDHNNIDTVLPKAREQQVGVISKRPIANAAWKDLAEQQGMYAEYARTYTERLAKMGVRPADLGFEGDAREVWPEIALRFTLSQTGVHTAIVGTTNPDHVEKNLALVEKGPLSEEVVRKLRSAFRRAESVDEAAWPGQT